jgi:predicted nucleic acid-binding protein
MIYVETSVLLALHLREPRSAHATHWYASCTDELVSAHWCATEFASALGIKQRNGQIDAAAADAAWRRFERLCANDLKLLPVEAALFARAAALTGDSPGGLRAGEALHLAAALDYKTEGIATLDQTLARCAKRHKLKLALTA